MAQQEMNNILALIQNRKMASGQTVAEIQTTQRVTLTTSPQNDIHYNQGQANHNFNYQPRITSPSPQHIGYQQRQLASPPPQNLLDVDFDHDVPVPFTSPNKSHIIDVASIVENSITSLDRASNDEYKFDGKMKLSVVFGKDGTKTLVITHEIVFGPDSHISSDDLIRYCADNN